MSRPAMPLEALVPYYRGTYMATIALKGRLAKLGSEHRPAVEAVTRYQTMVKSYLDALEATVKLHQERAQAAASTDRDTEPRTANPHWEGG